MNISSWIKMAVSLGWLHTPIIWRLPIHVIWLTNVGVQTSYVRIHKFPISPEKKTIRMYSNFQWPKEIHIEYEFTVCEFGSEIENLFVDKFYFFSYKISASSLSWRKHFPPFKYSCWLFGPPNDANKGFHMHLKKLINYKNYFTNLAEKSQCINLLHKCGNILALHITEMSPSFLAWKCTQNQEK